MTDFAQRFVSARRKLIAGQFSNLNDRQLQACLATEGPLLLLAGAGSGKTTVLINRVANLLKFGRAADSREIPEGYGEAELAFLENHLKNPAPDTQEAAEALCALDAPEPWNIIAITFTNKAAGELKERLERMLGDQAQGIWAATFHSACCRILRREAEHIGFTERFTIYDTDDSKRVLKDIAADMGLDDKYYEPAALMGHISRAKDALVSPAEMLKRAEREGNFRMEKVAEVYSRYQKRLRDADAMDFDDIIFNTVRLFDENPAVREHYAKRFRYVLVDEYQDTNNMQYLLTAHLASYWGNICVVGDDDQSIYKFRGATIKNILDFENQYKGCRTIRLEQNYRSTGHILEGANAVIRNNRGRKGKELWTDAGKGEKIELLTAEDENDEGEIIASRVLDAVSKGAAFSEFAVLYRMNAQSNKVEFSLKKAGVPYKVIGGTKFFERAEVKDILSYMCVVNNPADDLRLTRIINNPPRGIGGKTVENLQSVAQSGGASMFETACRAHDFLPLEKSASKLRLFAGMILDLQRAHQHMGLDAFFDYLIKATGYEGALLAKNDMESRGRLENIYELKSSVVAYMQATPEPTLHGFLEEIALYTELDTLAEEDSHVVLMTIHNAKGLEFDTVFLAGAEEGVFPSLRSAADSDELEEERRLAYVAMTRARKKLFITCTRRRMLFGRTTPNPLSRFVREIPEENIIGRQPPRQTTRLDSWDNWDRDDFGDSAPFSYSGGYGRSAGGYSGFGSGYGGSYTAKKAAQRPAAAPKAGFKLGDSVSHKAFGDGVVTQVTPMGNDALIEVAFAKTGTKRLMANAAAKHMTKK